MASSSVTRYRIDPAKVMARVHDQSAGGTVLFLGTVRDKSEGKAVMGLEYDVYRDMAVLRMVEIEEAMRAWWPIRKVAMVHRYGRLRVGEVSVAVAVSCEHRVEAFEACRFAIDAIKHSLPLWKKELLRGGGGKWVPGESIADSVMGVRRRRTRGAG